MTSLPSKKWLASASASVLLLGWCTVAPAADYAASVVVNGLNNPRGLSFGPDGGLYIAEAGVGAGSGPSTSARGDVFTYTQTGSVTRYLAGAQTRVYSGLGSLYGATSGQVNGPNDIVFNAAGAPLIAMGLGQNPVVRSTDLAPGGTSLARVFTPGGSSVDVGQYEVTHNPAGGPIDSNPWHLAVIPGATLMTDAGGNSLLRIGNDGSISTVATFASRVIGAATVEAVATGIAVGPDGAYYLGELTGFPFPSGAAQIYRIAPGEAPTVFATGFSMISDVTFGLDGSLYALEYDSDGSRNPGTTGALWQVAANGSRSLIYGDLTNPTGVAIGADGAFYVSNFGASSGNGEVVRIAAVPEPETYALMVCGLAAMAAAARRRVRKEGREQARSSELPRGA